ncbi:MAG TPA: MBL fold metallo-hydrolase [Vicinamibacterales bacterium]|jgi:glyoxylase-like metal-dependent hydrolase (beta-lactamase superfamily II)
MTLTSSITRLVALAAVSAATLQPSAPQAPLIDESAISKVSEHVHVISDRNVGLVPNVGIIVGQRAALVVDTGLGPRNGETVLHATRALTTTPDLYVVATHFHPEHALGESAFPASAKILRARSQQQDIDEFGLELAKTFASRSTATAELLKDARFRAADVIFDREYRLDLGGVVVRLLALGPTHTRGDTIVWVEGDRVLFAGDIVMNHAFVAFASPYSSVKAWLADFDQLSALGARVVVPSHGLVGDATLIEAQRTMMKAIQARAIELKRAGKSADETAETVQAEFQAAHPDWTAPARVAAIAKTAYTEAP